MPVARRRSVLSIVRMLWRESQRRYPSTWRLVVPLHAGLRRAAPSAARAASSRRRRRRREVEQRKRRGGPSQPSQIDVGKVAMKSARQNSSSVKPLMAARPTAMETRRGLAPRDCGTSAKPMATGSAKRPSCSGDGTRGTSVAAIARGSAMERAAADSEGEPGEGRRQCRRQRDERGVRIRRHQVIRGYSEQAPSWSSCS